MRLVLAEDHALLRDGLIRILEAHGHEIAAAVDDAAALESALADPAAEGAVLDVRLPPTHTDEGLRAAVAVRSRRPGFPVMVLSQYVERIYARELLASGEGGIGYLLKDRVGDVGEFVDALGRVATGGTVLDPQVVSAVMARQEPVERLARPRVRQAQVHGSGEQLGRVPRQAGSFLLVAHLTELGRAAVAGAVFHQPALRADGRVQLVAAQEGIVERAPASQARAAMGGRASRAAAGGRGNPGILDPAERRNPVRVFGDPRIVTGSRFAVLVRRARGEGVFLVQRSHVPRPADSRAR